MKLSNKELNLFLVRVLLLAAIGVIILTTFICSVFEQCKIIG